MAADSKEECVTEDAASPTVMRRRTAEVIVSLVLLALAALLGYDNWRTGMGWDASGPQAGYFPFYLSVILAAACLWGLAKTLLARAPDTGVFVTRAQLGRVLQVFVPTLLFVLCVQWLGLYVASFLLIAGFMKFIGRIAAWKALFTGFAFAAMMFVVFEIAFDVIMPKGPVEALFWH